MEPFNLCSVALSSLKYPIMPLCEDQFLRPYAFYLSVCKVIKFEPIRTKLAAGVLHFDGARHFIA